MTNIALFGAGRIGGMHARLIAGHPLATLRYVADAVPERAAELAARHGAKAVSVEEALADPALDAVLIATATDTHAGLIEQAARAGKHIFCEKPIDLDLARAAQAVEAARHAGVKLMIGLNRHFDPALMQLKALLAEGEIGRPIQLVIHNGDKNAPPAAFLRTSGFIIRDMMIHDIDLACWLLGGQPSAVFAAGAAQVDPEIGEIGDSDTGALTLVMPGGVLALLTVTRFAKFGFDARVEIRGTKGALWLHNPGTGHPVLQCLTETGLRTIAVPGLAPDGPMGEAFPDRFSDAFAAQADAFVRLVRGEAVAVPGADEATQAMKIADIASRLVAEAGAGFSEIE
ncbi:Gfo/Idh/MocA family oxidoreductase [Acidocella sp.]|uniref:Gfo/Idh/MocA family protein n=1 Tax=Acidocella sp. TaxID=50710 RepID=UPI00261F84E2|nr:Gfo/Idh/MocA family oxidoreductase [Acidocella sp.]